MIDLHRESLFRFRSTSVFIPLLLRRSAKQRKTPSPDTKLVFRDQAKLPKAPLFSWSCFGSGIGVWLRHSASPGPADLGASVCWAAHPIRLPSYSGGGEKATTLHWTH